VKSVWLCLGFFQLKGRLEISTENSNSTVGREKPVLQHGAKRHSQLLLVIVLYKGREQVQFPAI